MVIIMRSVLVAKVHTTCVCKMFCKFACGLRHIRYSMLHPLDIKYIHLSC